MGCMAGFLQIFDRHEVLTSKRLYTTKSLPPSPGSETTSEEDNAVESPLPSRELENESQGRLAPSPAWSTWKFSKEAPRLSLDSRVVVDAKGSLKPREIRTNECKTSSEENEVDDNDKQRRPPRVIARLMGLGLLPNSDSEPNEKAELRRSAPEVRGRDLFQYRFVDGIRKLKKRENRTNESCGSRGITGQRKCFYDSADFFPEPKQTVSIYGEVEKRLKLRGINKPSKDLETLKQILEALQLKGILHTKKPPNQTNNRSFVYENEQSPITVIKPRRSPASSPTMSPRHFRSENERNQRKSRGSVSPTRIQSPRVNVRKTGFDQTTNRSPRNRKSTSEIYQNEEKVIFVPTEDGTSTVSESSISTCSLTDTEPLHSIAEMAASTELQPSPVSVLDPSFYKEESSLSPVKKGSIDFKEDDTWSSSAISSDESKSEDKSDVCNFIYISDIMRASSYLPDDSDVFLLLEKQQLLKGKDTSKVSRLQRKLVFDIINEILNRKRQLPAWKFIDTTSLQQIWSEFQKIRERDSSDDLFDVICGLLRKDFTGDAINGWGDQAVEMSESVLDIERLIFKDVIVETILDLSAFSGESREISALRRKLVF
ncbi:Serine/arginine repetitive matrix protein 2 isoform 2 [Hibiscus syriacus]|uniref:Serine/arginine repetitive matrix protein 2 isoform 2 n=1 Tax=Hibiscus syriacus TaxID=106335 RepID=A0A6A3ABE6_HIBSY|nr:Serine/arginine repetitive matrix protein 2 isoform 2 [Hibiscus syriacus]